MSSTAPDLSAEFPALRRRVVARIYLTAIPSAVVAAYVFSLIVGLDGEDLGKVMVGVLVPILVASATQQFLVSSALVRRALASFPGEAPEARLIRLLELPRRVEVFSNVLAWLIGSVIFGVLLVVFHGRSPQVVLPATAVGLFASLFPGLMLALLIEDDVRPVALAEFRRNPKAKLPRGGFFWPRQGWYLPYAFAVALVSLMVFSGMVLTAKAEALVTAVTSALERGGHGEVAPFVRDHLARAIAQIGLPLAGIAGVLLVAFLITGLLLARRQGRAATAVEGSLRAMAAGAPAPPAWVATDETGDLAAATAVVSEEMKHVFAQLRAMAAGELGRELEGESGLIHAFRESRLAMLELADRMAALARGEPAAASRVAGDLGAAFARLEASFQAIVEQASTIAQGDLRRDADVPGALGAAIRRMTGNLRSIIGQTQAVSTNIGDIVVSLQTAATQLSTATTEQVAAVTETANTVTEMAQTSAVSADRAAELIRQGESAAGVVEEGGEAAGATAHAMLAITGSFEKVAAASAALGERVQRIDSITETVGFLADQSSTLAINAAIEAARAGEAGKGFAVVAREIRTLAADSRKAASQIRDLLQEIRERTKQVDASVSAGTQTLDDGGRLVARLGDIVGQLGVTVNDAVGLMRQIEGSARQHQAGVGQVSQALTNMQKASESIRDGARLLGELSGKAHELSSNLQKTSNAYVLPEARA